MLAQVPSCGRNPRGPLDILAYPVPKACQQGVLGSWVPSCFGVARSASSPKAVLALGCSFTIHDKAGPAYSRTATCRHTTASAGEVHWDWAPGRDNNEYTVVHTVRHRNTATEAEGPEKTVTQPPRPAPQQWTLYKLLAHARTVAEHSIQPYTDIKYVEHMLQEWPKYETEVLDGHT